MDFRVRPKLPVTAHSSWEICEKFGAIIEGKNRNLLQLDHYNHGLLTCQFQSEVEVSIKGYMPQKDTRSTLRISGGRTRPIFFCLHHILWSSTALQVGAGKDVFDRQLWEARSI